MDPWRLTTSAQRRVDALAGTALASCVLAWLAGFGWLRGNGVRSFRRERPCGLNPGTPRTISHREHRAYEHAASDRRGKRRRRRPRAGDGRPILRRRKPPTGRQAWMSRNLSSWPRCRISQTLPPEAPSAKSATASTPDPAPEKVADATASVDEKSFVVASLTDSSQVFPPR